MEFKNKRIYKSNKLARMMEMKINEFPRNMMNLI